MPPYKHGLRYHLPLLRPFLEIVAGLFIITVVVALMDTTQDAILTAVVELLAIFGAVVYAWQRGWHFGLNRYSGLYITSKMPKLSAWQWLVHSLTIFVVSFSACIPVSYLLGDSDVANVACVVATILVNVGAALYFGARTGWQAASNTGRWN